MAGKIAQLVKCLPNKHEDVSTEPQHPSMIYSIGASVTLVLGLGGGAGVDRYPELVG